MAGLNIPGVTDPYNTNETVEKLMQVERIPLTREQNQLETYKDQRQAWREVNTQLTTLRDSIKTLYSYENPFNSKLTTSSNEDAITATANRSADIQSFKVDVIQPATSDRFLSGELDADYQVPSGVYTYKVKDKTVTMNWKGGSLKSFSDALNKRSNGVIKSLVIGASQGKKTIMIESLATGRENRLVFEGSAKDFAINSGMITAVETKKINFGNSASDFIAVPPVHSDEQTKMPPLSLTRTNISNGTITVAPRGAFQLAVPAEVAQKNTNHITFKVRSNAVTDITEALNKQPDSPVIPDSGFAEFEGIVVRNSASETLIKAEIIPQKSVDPINDKNVLYAVMADGSEKLISTPDLFSNDELTIDLPVSDYEGLKSIIVRNQNTGYSLEVSAFSAYDSAEEVGYTPNNAIEEAGDCTIKYEGIKITRPTNDIDDVVPEITLHIHEKTEKAATITVKADKEASKNALIEFVGKYNQVVAKLNVLSQNKSEIIEELEYLSADEKDALSKQLGMFQADFTLSSIKNNMASILNTPYKFSDYATITLLAQIGISTNVSGFSGSYSASRLRGYLEIDEKKLDDALENNLEEIKNLFGYDSDGDLIIDSGIAYRLDKEVSAYTQTGGILSMKTSSLDSQIKTSESKITKLESQMSQKEAELKSKFSTMQGSLNSLESQQNTISNFTNRQNNSNR
ncbi:MAG: flagellar filament capping protein FliD [Treponema sp.]|nr:flagellar filament capping protein FliD [Treponema sp.]